MTQSHHHAARLAVGLALTMPLGLASCGKPPAKPPHPTPSVDVVVLRAAPVTITTQVPGRVVAHRVADVRPQVNGVILKRLFTEGDVVRAGQPLYQIDPKPYAASLASAQAAAAKARAAVVAAKLTVQRYQKLASAFAVSKQDLDNAVATLGQDQADVASADASVDSARINLAYTRMYAPIPGRTGRSSVTEGALVTQNQTTALVTITELNPIYVDVTQPTGTLLRLKHAIADGQMASASNGPGSVSLTLEDGSAFAPHGTLQFSEVSVDESTGSVTLRALYPNPDGLLLPGMFVRETLTEGVRQNAILVPQRGITHDERGDPTAMVIDQNGKVAPRTLTATQAIGTNWLVEAGLAAGDRVVVSGLQQIHPGDTPNIQVVNADAPAAQKE